MFQPREYSEVVRGLKLKGGDFSNDFELLCKPSTFDLSTITGNH